MENNTLSIPYDVECEQAILGAIIEENERINAITGIVTPNSFYKPAHQHIFRGMLELNELNQPIDEIILGDQLRSMNQLDEVGGYAYLAELIECVPSSGNLVYYAHIIQEHAILRDLISTTTEIGRKSRDPEQNVSELLVEAEHKIRQLSIRTNNKKYTRIKNVLVKNFKKLEKASESADEITGMATGFIDLDRYTFGLQDSDLIIIGARPSMGKTSLALNIASYVTTGNQAKGAVLIFSLEMSEEQLSERMLQAKAKINGKSMKTGNLEQEEWDKLAMATEKLSPVPIFINDSTSLTSQELISIAKQLNNEEEEGVSLVIVDYLQLMKGNRPNMPREQEIAEISRSLKTLAKDLNIPVIALSQLNRGLESRSDKHPQLSDLRESGAIEQDADVILFIYRDEVYHDDSAEKGIAEIIIAKQRNGPTGIVRLAFIERFTKFANLARQGAF